MLVGLTGGIGSGKTAASDAFAELNIPIVDTDIIARNILKSHPELLEKLTARFGNNILDSQGNLIREKLRGIAFSTDEKKADLDSIMHPVIRRQTLTEIKSHDKASYCIVVVPLLIETNFKDLVDRVLVVTAPFERRLTWLKKRSNLNENDSKNIISKQTSDKERLKYADDHIQNDGTLKDIKQDVEKLHKKYLSLST